VGKGYRKGQGLVHPFDQVLQPRQAVSAGWKPLATQALRDMVAPRLEGSLPEHAQIVRNAHGVSSWLANSACFGICVMRSAGQGVVADVDVMMAGSPRDVILAGGTLSVTMQACRELARGGSWFPHRL
jgi:hypothetical protein